MVNFLAADILYFDHYRFTDDGTNAKHFGLVLLPSDIMEFENNLLCSVITSKEEKYYSLKLDKENYNCFSVDSYACFMRRDIQCIDDLNNRKQPVSRLNKIDINKSFQVIKKAYYGAGDVYLMAAVIREWKKIR